MNDPRHPARRRDYDTRRIVSAILAANAAKVDKRAALLTLGLPLTRTMEIVR